ncbi:substrate-binding periplasmic protein [Caballeronia sp. 15711]|uniref:substrate-binding periplasmic protein n=1 Tax=Caballeronia sp. 15711 TaxID=3391029 RepID=UPI0039E61162
MKDRSSPQNGGIAAKAGGLAFVKQLLRASVVALVFAMAWSSTGAAAAEPSTGGIDAIRQRGVLRVAVLDEFPWLKERHGAGEPFEGSAWMIAKEAARRLHVQLVTVHVGFDDKLRILDESRADATIAPLIATTERTRQYGVVVYSQASQCLFGRADDPKLSGARSLDDLNRPDVTIAVVKDAPQGRWLRTRLPSTKVIEVPGNITTVPTAEIVAGRANVATIDQYFFAATSRSTPGLASLPFGTSCLDSHELTLPIGLAVPKDRTDLKVLFTHIVADSRARLASEQRRVVAAGP